MHLEASAVLSSQWMAHLIQIHVIRYGIVEQNVLDSILLVLM